MKLRRSVLGEPGSVLEPTPAVWMCMAKVLFGSLVGSTMVLRPPWVLGALLAVD